MSHIPTQAFALIGGCGLGMLVAIVLMLLAIRQAMRDARKPRFPDKIPCADCGDLESLDSLGQCSACGRLFCCGCADPMEDERRLVCEKCRETTR